MSFKDYIVLVAKARCENPRWREGQTAFNVLYVIRPDLSEQIRSNFKLDPFYNDKVLEQFYPWVETNWSAK